MGGEAVALSARALRTRFGAVAEPGSRPKRSESRETREWTPLGEKLREWRLGRARADGVPPYVVFHDSVLQAIADARPESLGELSQLHGIGPAKLDRYGADLLGVLAAA